MTRPMSTSAHGTEVHICTATSLSSRPGSYAQTGPPCACGIYQRMGAGISRILWRDAVDHCCRGVTAGQQPPHASCLALGPSSRAQGLKLKGSTPKCQPSNERALGHRSTLLITRLEGMVKARDRGNAPPMGQEFEAAAAAAADWAAAAQHRKHG